MFGIILYLVIGSAIAIALGVAGLFLGIGVTELAGVESHGFDAIEHARAVFLAV